MGRGAAAALIVRAFEAGCRILAIERDMGGVRSVAHTQRAPGPCVIGRIAERRTQTTSDGWHKASLSTPIGIFACPQYSKQSAENP